MAEIRADRSIQSYGLGEHRVNPWKEACCDAGAFTAKRPAGSEVNYREENGAMHCAVVVSTAWVHGNEAVVGLREGTRNFVMPINFIEGIGKILPRTTSSLALRSR